MKDNSLAQAVELYVRKNFIDQIRSLLEKRLEERRYDELVRKIYRMPIFSTFFSAVGGHDIDFMKLWEKNKSETFSEMLTRLVTQSGEKNFVIYKRANIDRRHFSKIINNKDYKPGKQTVLAFAIALKLDFEKTKALLETAGFTLSNANLSDIIVSFFIEHKIFDVDQVNLILYEYNQTLLGDNQPFLGG